MGVAYPELGRAEPLMSETLKLEETRFQQHARARPASCSTTRPTGCGQGAALPGEVAFKLYDTFGFPLDLTQDALRAPGPQGRRAGFDAAMERQKAEARAAWAGSGEAATERVWFDLRDAVGATEFLGYDTETAEGKVVALVVDGKQVDKLEAGAGGSVLVNQTPFYAESGGQIGDTGAMFTAGRRRVRGRRYAEEARRSASSMSASVNAAALKVGDAVELRVDITRRRRLRANHSATHLLHEALRRRLGEHVTQKGSLVAPDRLRFDFSHPKPLSADEIRTVEDDVNAWCARTRRSARG